MANFTTAGSDTFPAGHCLQVKCAENFTQKTFDHDLDVVVEVALTNVVASSYVAIWVTTTVNIASQYARGLETNIYRKDGSSMGSIGSAQSGGTKVNPASGNASENSGAFSYFDPTTDDINAYIQSPYWGVDESPGTGTVYYAMVCSGYAGQSPVMGSHDGFCSIIAMEFSQ